MKSSVPILGIQLLLAVSAISTAEQTGVPPKPGLTLADLKAQFPQSKEGNFIMEVPQIFFTATDKEVQVLLTGKTVETVGQVKLTGDKRFCVFRFLTQCCAADARSYEIPVEYAEREPELKATSWVKLAGTVSYKQENGKTIPVIIATEVKETEAPKQTILK